ncbi:MAG: glucosaminidase domain-containing protein [Candidatus Levybacteria bacterium]|nr:glucosaminidase domain-containing protein [Candidatus Levybacteria bacterium]
MGKIVKLLTFLLLTPLTLLLSLVYLSYLAYGADVNRHSFSNISQPVAFAALPSQESTLNDEIVTLDKRIENLRTFFNRHNSSLEPYAEYFVSVSEKYELDFRLLPAIAMQESNLCKKAPKGSYNCWGFGIYGKKMTKFTSYEEAIDTVAKTLFIEYKSKGLNTPEEIMAKYTPSNTGAWANSVNLFMDHLE